MEKRRLGQTDLNVSVLCMGTMMMGSQADRKTSFELLDHCFDRGIDFYDTAEIYPVPITEGPRGHGASEEILGDWVKSRGLRDRVTIATKVSGRGDPIPDLRPDGGGARVTRVQVLNAVEGSLRRLKTDVIDLYQIHWPDRPLPNFGKNATGYVHDETPSEEIEETLIVFQDLILEGKIRAFGVSNETPWGVMRFITTAERKAMPRIATIQNAYNLANRVFEYGLAEVCMREDISCIPYSPLAQGYLSGKYLGGAVPNPSRKALIGDRIGRYSTPNAETAFRAYVDLAAKHRLDPSAMSLAFLLSRPWVASAIFGASTPEQIDLAVEGSELTLTDEIIQDINAIHRTIPNPCP